MSANHRQLVIGIAVVVNVVAAGMAFFLMSPQDVEVEPAPAAPAAVPVAPSSPPPILAPPVAEPGVAETEPGAAPMELPAADLHRPEDPARAAKRAEIWGQLRKQHGLEPAAEGDPAPSDSGAALLPSLDREYIKTAIREQLVPVARECYESALEDDPKLGGKIMLSFEIVGAEDVGGIVEEASVVDEESDLASPFVRECMRESLLGVEFPAPEHGGRVEVHYPFIFAADDD